MSNDKDIREIVGTGDLPHCECCGRQYIAVGKLCMNCQSYVSTKQIEARIDEREKMLSTTAKPVLENDARIKELKSQLSTERKDDETR